jgi:hypothetical protein
MKSLNLQVTTFCEFSHGHMYGKLEDTFWSTGAKYCVDLAFGQVNKESQHKLSQDLFGSLAPTRQERKLELRKKAGNISATDRRVGDAHDSDFVSADQGSICVQRMRRAETCLKMFILSNDKRARMVGIYQIWNTYMKHLGQNANTDVFF